MNLHFNHQLAAAPSPLQERALREAYLALYALAGARLENHFIFTSSGAEGINHAIFAAYLDITRKTGKNHFLCTSLDEAPAIMAMSRLQELGCLFQMIPANPECQITPKEVAEMLTPRTAMLSMSWVNGLTGVVQPVSSIAKICKERGILFHVDATHALGKGDFTFDESGADLLTFNGSRAGTGGMFIRKGTEISPLILGGKEQGQMRGGTFNASALIELAKWAKEERAHSDHYTLETARLRNHFEQLVCSRLPLVKPLFQAQDRVSHITSFIFPGATSDALLYLLQQKGVFATFGGNSFQHFSHILKACGLCEPDCHSGLSFSFSYETTEEQVELGVERLVEVVNSLQKYSAYIMGEAS